MGIKDTFKNLVNYFEVEDANEVDEQYQANSTDNKRPAMHAATIKPISRPVERPSRGESRGDVNSGSESRLQRLHDRQQELMSHGEQGNLKSTIDIKFPKRYEDAPEMVNLLLDNASILIDFQYMSEQQARRCLDYLDGARSVLSGNLKKVSNTMWLLTPVNVTVHIEELRNTNVGANQDSQFDFDMKR